MKLGFLVTHPIQYDAPLFRELAKRPGVDLRVYFCHRPTPREQGQGFGVDFEWDVDLTSGYNNQFLSNRARAPAVGFWGYDTPDIRRVVKPGEFDWFILRGWAAKSYWQGMRACWSAGVRVGVRSDSQLPQKELGLSGRVRHFCKRWLYPRFIKKLDVCLPYGTRSADYFRTFQARRIGVVPHFVDNAFFSSRTDGLADATRSIRSKWGIAETAVCFLFCGKFERKKRPLDLLAALEKLIAENRRTVHLLMVGDGPLRGEVERVVGERGLPVTLAGFLNQGEISRAYAVADALVLPSESGETWGLVVNEAMACGKPVIVSRSCGCSVDMVDGRDTGVSFDCGDVAGLTEAMSRMLGDRERAAWGRNARALVEREFNPVNSADRLLAAVAQHA